MKTLFDTVDSLERAMTFHRDRHSVLAGNVANIDTPGYKPLDLEQVSPTSAGVVPLESTDPHHMQPIETAGGARVFKDPDVVGADGNSVSLEREMAKVDANRTRYATASELVSRRLALLRYTSTDGT